MRVTALEDDGCEFAPLLGSDRRPDVLKLLEELRGPGDAEVAPQFGDTVGELAVFDGISQRGAGFGPGRHVKPPQGMKNSCPLAKGLRKAPARPSQDRSQTHKTATRFVSARLLPFDP
jgi:hypothetical protein